MCIYSYYFNVFILHFDQILNEFYFCNGNHHEINRKKNRKLLEGSAQINEVVKLEKDNYHPNILSVEPEYRISINQKK